MKIKRNLKKEMDKDRRNDADDKISVKSFESPTKPIVKASHDDASDYSDWNDDD